MASVRLRITAIRTITSTSGPVCAPPNAIHAPSVRFVLEACARARERKRPGHASGTVDSQTNGSDARQPVTMTCPFRQSVPRDVSRSPGAAVPVADPVDDTALLVSSWRRAGDPPSSSQRCSHDCEPLVTPAPARTKGCGPGATDRRPETSPSTSFPYSP